VVTASNGHSIAGWVEFFAGTNSVNGSVTVSSVTGAPSCGGLGGDVFDNTQPSDGGNDTAQANVDVATVGFVPEPASMVLLVLAGPVILGRRRPARS
jgi:hypothetical protein